MTSPIGRKSEIVGFCEIVLPYRQNDLGRIAAIALARITMALAPLMLSESTGFTGQSDKRLSPRENLSIRARSGLPGTN